ncbi:capsular polysaccharide synthesis protein [Tatumella sp. JGM118]|uniref:capsular polysaccharide synthesis protein n=1 Tax=Tatumella sp. JGM118 TaxID=2799796 RepID=UPI001BAFDB31|nr:capsular polysaccharide synthesis protein [Tatumella sp. JGM118]MBS0910040.1 capsular biosynthesis protein [Tatumella sp. JGM118]
MNGFFYIKILKILRLVLKKTNASERFLDKINVLIQNEIKAYLQKQLTGKKYPKEKNQLYPDGNYVWVSWLQGEKNAPFIVSQCINSIKKNSPKDYKVMIIDEDNFSSYVKLPMVITKKYKSGIITKTHFSDILRWALLSEYGGIWMDSTIFLAKEINNIGGEGFFTLKQSSEEAYQYVPKGRWSGFFVKVESRYYPAKYIYNLLLEYWTLNNQMVDYFLIDYVLDITFDRLSEFKNDIEQLGIYGNEIYFLMESLKNERFLYDHDSIGIYKLSYKISKEEENKLKYLFKKI